MRHSENVGIVLVTLCIIVSNIACFCGGPPPPQPQEKADTSPYAPAGASDRSPVADMGEPSGDLGADLEDLGADLAPETSAAPPVPVFKWKYNKTQSKMSDEVVVFANLVSDNVVNFGFPYQGEQNMLMMIRAKSESKVDAVMFTLGNAQFLCDSWDGCSATVRLDKGKPFKVKMSGPSDHSSNTLFVSRESAFVKRLQGGNKMLISFEFYQEGSHVFEFDVSGLDLKAQFHPTPSNDQK